MSLEVSSKGLNARSNNLNVPRRRCSSSWLRKEHGRDEHAVYPGSGPSSRGKTPTSCFGGLYCLERFTELVELEVATMAKNPRSQL